MNYLKCDKSPQYIDTDADPNVRFVTRLAQLVELPVGWFDGDGQSVSVQAQNSACILQPVLDIYNLLSTCFMYPTIEGGLQLEWSDPDITITITANGVIEFSFS